MNSILTRLKEHASSVVVVTLTAAFATALMLAVGAVVAIAESTGLDEVGPVNTILGVIAWVFLGIALYVALMVITNAFATIIAGRRREIALMRLIGSSSHRQRRVIVREGLAVGLVGAVLGYLIGLALLQVTLRINASQGLIPDITYPFFTTNLVLPLLTIVGVSSLAAWYGSRAVLSVTPIEAVGAAQPATYEALRTSVTRRVMTALLLIGGLVVMALGIWIGLETPEGLPIAFLGGALSFSGVVTGAVIVLPKLMEWLGAVFRGTAAGRLAVANSRRYPERSARVMIGLVIGVTLVVMFAVASETLLTTVSDEMDPMQAQMFAQVMRVIALAFGALIGFSAVLAAIGTANSISLNVLQRTRELGLLRALGLSRSQLRSMVWIESALLAITGIGFGALLGTFYGWAGAQATLGSTVSGGLVSLTVPWPLLLGIVASAALLVWISSALPSRRAMRLQPVAALASVH